MIQNVRIKTKDGKIIDLPNYVSKGNKIVTDSGSYLVTNESKKKLDEAIAYRDKYKKRVTDREVNHIKTLQNFHQQKATYHNDKLKKFSGVWDSGDVYPKIMNEYHKILNDQHLAHSKNLSYALKIIQKHK